MLLVCEPECLGDSHEEVNTAFLVELSLAFPEEKIVFFGENEHLLCIKKNLERKHMSLENLVFKPGEIPPHPLRGIRKYFEYLQYLKDLFVFAQSNHVRRMIFLSVNDYNLRAIKKLLKKTEIRCTCVVHGILETLLEKRNSFPRKAMNATKFWEYVAERLFQFKRTFLSDNHNINYIVLSPVIRQRLISLYPEVQPVVAALHHPYLFEKAELFTPFNDRSVRFGTIGSLFESKGLRAQERLINDLLPPNESKGKFEIIIIGEVDFSRRYPSNIRIAASGRRLSREDISRLAREVDYFLFLYPSDSYQLMASGAYFDTLSYAKPVIALRNSFISYYFSLMGNVGFIFDTYEELLAKVLEIVDTLPSDVLIQQRQTILKQRERLTQFNREELSRILSK